MKTSSDFPLEFDFFPEGHFEPESMPKTFRQIGI